jgi:2-(1,2-epoxy-1,2-dihydrophenyl)acetyl-CoA isomerase
VYDQEVFDAKVTGLAELLASRAPLALQGIKKNLEVAGRSSLAEALDVEAATMDENMSTADAAEAAAAFFEKREPRFTGR